MTIKLPYSVRMTLQIQCGEKDNLNNICNISVEHVCMYIYVHIDVYTLIHIDTHTYHNVFITVYLSIFFVEGWFLVFAFTK